MTRPTETGPGTADLDLNRTAPLSTSGAAPSPRQPTSPSQPTQPIPPPAQTRKINLTTAQVGAAAGASATSAVGASFFGAGGTIVGAALGAVISTVAGAVYTRSLERAAERLRESTVVVKRLPNDGARRPDAVPTHLAEVAEPPVEPADADLETTVAAPSDRSRRRKPLIVFAGIAAAGFALALFGISAAESLLGHPVSGGNAGTSVGRVIGSDSGTSQQDPAPAPESSATTTAEPSASDGDQGPTATPGVTDQPTAGPTDAPTTQPSQEPSSEATQAPPLDQAPATP